MNWTKKLARFAPPGDDLRTAFIAYVLALLVFKPAPMYILDEVDAALDVSHTQNIGRMLREHFGGSQFIVVSLKKGMFTNANVLFRTNFVDGVSTATRTMGQVEEEGVRCLFQSHYS